jgi:hypothetical protein
MLHFELRLAVPYEWASHVEGVYLHSATEAMLLSSIPQGI